MNVLFLTLLDFNSLDERNIYTDLLREFKKHNHSVSIISPIEKKRKKDTHIVKRDGYEILKLRIGNIQKTNILEKGISILTLESIFIHGIKKYFSNVKFDLIIYSTPPITFCNAVKYVKNRDNSKTYLLLKDIFPQNSLDLGMLSKSGFKGLIYNFFRNKEKSLYKISDHIGCMSQANVEYILKHNPQLSSSIVDICPNSVEPIDMSVDETTRIEIRNKYNIPLDKKVFVYGGNLGKPQGIDFMIKCLKSQEKNTDVFFLVVGDGTEYEKLEKYIKLEQPSNVRLLKRLPKEDYDKMVGACDVGMIFLDYKFTIPNFPSRLLSYMQAKIPIFACIDVNTDIGKIVFDGGFGHYIYSNDVNQFKEKISLFMNMDDSYKEKEWRYLCDYYSSKVSYEIIINCFYNCNK